MTPPTGNAPAERPAEPIATNAAEPDGPAAGATESATRGTGGTDGPGTGGPGTDGPGTDGPATGDEAEAEAKRDRARRHRRIDQIFGDVLPSTTRDEREPGHHGGFSREHYQASKPPHWGEKL